MKVNSVKINSFKSFGDENNYLELGDINTILGLNESGKSNIIEALSGISFNGIAKDSFFRKINNNIKEKPSFEIVMSPFKFEMDKFNLKDTSTVIIINGKDEISVSGGLLDYLESNEEFHKNLNIVSDSINEVSVKLSKQVNRDNLKHTIEKIKQYNSKIYIKDEKTKSIIDNLELVEGIGNYVTSMKYCIDFLESVQVLLPSFIFLKSLDLKSQYSLSELRDNQKQKPALIEFLNSIGWNIKKILEYWDLRSEDDKQNFLDDFNNQIETRLIAFFNNFYDIENIQMVARLNSESISFLIKSSGNKLINYNERSNGLKWYIMLFVQMLRRVDLNNDNNNMIILLDEPGVYLHVNAQKQILDLFEVLAEKGNQIVYTTHMPTMIYENRLDRTRLIIKNKEGFSTIENKYYHLNNNTLQIDETIAPILKSIGMNMNFNLLMSEKNTAIITEGISDYNYLMAYISQKGIRGFKIIPSTGAGMVKNIVAILKGWGIKTIALLDNDKEGKKAKKEILKIELLSEREVILVNGGIEKENSYKVIEDLFSSNDKHKFFLDSSEYKNNKGFFSLSVLKRIEEGNETLDEETLSNFGKIFDSLLNKIN